MNEKIETNTKASKFKVNDKVIITKHKNIFNKDYTENWSRKMFMIDSLLKANHLTYKVKELNGEKIIGSFYEKGMMLSIL